MKEYEPKLVESKPKLKDIHKTLGLLDGYTEWKKDLPEKIGSWENSLELSENVQRVVLEQVQDKIVPFQEKVSSIKNFPREEIIDTIVNNWPEGIQDEMAGQRREVLLAVAGHVVKHMETKAYQEVIVHSGEEDLEKLGLNSELRDVVVRLLDASIESDLLFIRSLAFSGLTKAPEEASLSHFYVPNDKDPHTINELFPKEAQYLARKFKEISEMPINWNKFPEGETFKKYLKTISESYSEQDVDKIDECYKKVRELYQQTAVSDFPIVVIPTEHGWSYAPPYHQPELKICLKATECVEMQKDIDHIQEIFIDIIKRNGYIDLGTDIAQKKIIFVNSIGDYGVNLLMKTTAQENGSVIAVYAGEQRRYHENLTQTKKYKIKTVDPTDEYDLDMSFKTLALHEIGHCHPDNNALSEKFGKEQSFVIEEVMAEQFYRMFVAEFIEKYPENGTKEKWAIALLENSLELIVGMPENDPYYAAAVYALNVLFEEKMIEFNMNTGSVEIKNIDDFFKIQNKLSKKVLELYEDKSMNQAKAKKWVKENCKPSEIVKKISNFLKNKNE